MDLAAGRPGHDRDDFAVDLEFEAVVAGGDCHDLPGVDHADVDLLGGHHDGATL